MLQRFREEKLGAPEHRIIALGYADSERLRTHCPLNDDECNGLYRRTTFRSRMDARKLEEQRGRSQIGG